MAKKKRLKKRKEPEASPLRDFQLSFTDITMLETDGKFELVKEIMERDSFANDWVIKSTLIISSDFGECRFVLDFYHDGSVYIVDYVTSVSNIAYNMDLRCLSQWCQMNGWNIPKPIELVIIDDVDFWKHMWNTLLIDSEYLDKRYGVRAALSGRVVEEESDDDML